MNRDLAVRAAVIALLAGALLAMGVHYESQWEERERYRTTMAAIDADPDAYADRPVYLWMTVESASEERIVARTGSGADARRVIVDRPAAGAAESASPGDLVQVFGRLELVGCDGSDACYRLDAERVVVHDAGNRLRMYLVSAAGGLLALGAFLRRWRFDPRRAAFVPRGEDAPGNVRGEECTPEASDG